jgi:hypothetical protein
VAQRGVGCGLPAGRRRVGQHPGVADPVAGEVHALHPGGVDRRPTGETAGTGQWRPVARGHAVEVAAHHDVVVVDAGRAGEVGEVGGERPTVLVGSEVAHHRHERPAGRCEAGRGRTVRRQVPRLVDAEHDGVHRFMGQTEVEHGHLRRRAEPLEPADRAAHRREEATGRRRSSGGEHDAGRLVRPGSGGDPHAVVAALESGDAGVEHDLHASLAGDAQERLDDGRPPAVDVEHPLLRELQLRRGGSGVEQVRGVGEGRHAGERAHHVGDLDRNLGQPLVDGLPHQGPCVELGELGEERRALGLAAHAQQAAAGERRGAERQQRDRRAPLSVHRRARQAAGHLDRQAVEQPLQGAVQVQGVRALVEREPLVRRRAGAPSAGPGIQQQHTGALASGGDRRTQAGDAGPHHDHVVEVLVAVVAHRRHLLRVRRRAAASCDNCRVRCRRPPHRRPRGARPRARSPGGT